MERRDMLSSPFSRPKTLKWFALFGVSVYLVLDGINECCLWFDREDLAWYLWHAAIQLWEFLAILLIILLGATIGAKYAREAGS